MDVVGVAHQPNGGEKFDDTDGIAWDKEVRPRLQLSFPRLLEHVS